MQRDREDTGEGEVRILDVSSIHVGILVQEVWILKLFNRFLRNKACPIIDSQSSIFKDHLLHI